MSDPVVNASLQDLLAIVGQKEVERLMLIARVQALEALVKELQAKPTHQAPKKPAK